MDTAVTGHALMFDGLQPIRSLGNGLVYFGRKVTPHPMLRRDPI